MLLRHLGVLPRDEAIAAVKGAIRKTYGRRGSEVVRRNEAAVDTAVAALHQVPVPESPDDASRACHRWFPRTRRSSSGP